MKDKVTGLGCLSTEATEKTSTESTSLPRTSSCQQPFLVKEKESIETLTALVLKEQSRQDLDWYCPLSFKINHVT